MESETVLYSADFAVMIRFCGEGKYFQTLPFIPIPAVYLHISKNTVK